MDRSDFFYLQSLSQAELDQGFNDAEVAMRAIMVDLGFFGMLKNGAVVQHGVGNMTVDVTGPAAGYDQSGSRVGWPEDETLDCTVDHDAVDCTVASSGNKRWISIIARFKRDEQEDRTDGNGVPLKYRRLESFELLVFAGTEAVAATIDAGGNKPSLPTDGILLADVKLYFGQTDILTADIDDSRRQDILVTPQLEIDFQDHIAGDDFRHTGAMIDLAASAAWADTTANGTGTAQARVDKIISDLNRTADPTGLKKIGGRAYSPGGHYALSAGTGESQTRALLDAINDAWASFGAASGITTGALGGWLDGTANGASTVQARLGQFVTDLSSQLSNTVSGGAKIGLGASGSHLGASTVQAAMNYLESNVPWKDAANTFSAAQTFANITASGTNKYKLASRTVVRTYLPGPIGDPANFNNGNAIVTGSVGVESGAKVVHFPLDDLPNGAVILSVAVYIKGATGHGGAEPATGPKIRLQSWNWFTGALVDESSLIEDITKSGAYDAYHLIPPLSGNASLGTLAVTVDKTAKRYLLEFISEASTGAANAAVVAIVVQMTITSQDDAAG